MNKNNYTIHIVFTILSFFLFLPIHLYACSCIGIDDLKQAQEEAFKDSDIIIVAEVTKVFESQELARQGWFNNKIYELKVIERYKGAEMGDIFVGQALTSCDLYPGEKETWLVYGKTEKNGMISMNECGLSRSIFKPESILYHHYRPQPPPKGQKEDEDFIYNLSIELAEIKLLAAKDLKDEILWLRSKK